MTKERNNLHRLMQKKKTVLRIPSFLYGLIGQKVCVKTLITLDTY